MLQLGLANKIIAALGLDNESTKAKDTPSSYKPLLKDENDPPQKESWNYTSVIGILLYLASNSHPEISFAVNQCARYLSFTRLCHKQAVKRIAKYLIGTKDKGVLIQPLSDLILDLYVDTDFAGI